MTGRTLWDNRFHIDELVAGDPWWGMYRARQAEGRTRCLATLTTAPRDLEELSRALRLEVAGITTLVRHGLVSDDEAPHYAMVEIEPEGRPLAEWPHLPLGAGPASRLVVELARLTHMVHELGQPLGGLHPRVIYALDTAEGPRLAGCAPRFSRLLERSATEFKRPLFDPTFEAPEVLYGGRRRRASDVFSLSAVLAWLTTGTYPFGDTSFDEVMAHDRGQPPPSDLPQALAGLVTAGLAPGADDRLDLAALIEGLGGLSTP